MRRVAQAGAKPVTALFLTPEWQRDLANRDTYDAVTDLAKTHYGAYGIGVEYAYIMVHGAAASLRDEPGRSLGYGSFVPAGRLYW